MTGAIRSTDAAIPEPASWVLMLAGFGAIGSQMRRRQRRAVETLRLQP
jgi:hypothetical protein